MRSRNPLPLPNAASGGIPEPIKATRGIRGHDRMALKQGQSVEKQRLIKPTDSSVSEYENRLRRREKSSVSMSQRVMSITRLFSRDWPYFSAIRDMIEWR